MKVIITAGPTYEPLDLVRRLTNFSTGKLGVGLAHFLFRQEWDVILLRGISATFPSSFSKMIPFSTTDSLIDELQDQSERSRKLGNEVNAMFHTAAVSDFRFGNITTKKGEKIRSIGKCSADSSLMAELIPTEKVISNLRSLFPNAFLAGWKYEVEGTHEDAFEKARRQIEENDTNLCVINGPAYGRGYAVMQRGKMPFHIDNVNQLYITLQKFVQAHHPS